MKIDIRRLRKELREAKKNLDKETERRYKLERKLEILVDRLATIAAGMHYSGESAHLKNNDDKLQNTAAMGLAKIAKLS